MSPLGNSSPFCLSFSDLLVTLRVLESSGGSLPVSFLASLQGKVLFSLDPSFTVSGNAIADSVASFRLLVVDPIPGSSKDGDSAIPFICRLVGVSDSTPPSVVGASALRSAGVADPVPVPPLLSLNPPAPPSIFPEVPLSSVTSSLPPSGLVSAPPVVFLGSLAPTLSWSLLSLVSSPAVLAPVSSLVPLVFSMGYSVPSSSSPLVPPVAPVPSSFLAPLVLLPSSFAPSVPHPSADASAAPCVSSLGGIPSRLASVFAFLKDLDCALKEAIFYQLISSLQVSLNSQAKASCFSVVSDAKRRETLVSVSCPSFTLG